MAMQVSYATDDTTEAAKPSINVPDTDLLKA